MKKTLFAMAAGITLAAGSAFAQAPADKPKTEKTDKAAPAAGEMPPAPKPGPEHEILKKSVGTWDATVEEMAPGAPSKTSKGTETAKLVGGLWLVSDFKSEMMGQPFEGHAVGGYDPTKKKYVGTWIDTMSPYLQTMEGTYDEKTATSTMIATGIDIATGKPSTSKMITRYESDDEKVFEIMMPVEGKEGEWWKMMEITYTRRK
jgi:hypothetical protein